MAAISGRRATDERVTCLRIFADADGESHMEDVDIVLQPKQLFKDGRALRLTDNFPASWYNICYVPSGISDCHNPPQRLLSLWLTGEVEFETSDGDIRRLPAGSSFFTRPEDASSHSVQNLLVRSPRSTQELSARRDCVVPFRSGPYLNFVNVSVGCMDDNSWFSPQVVVYAKDRPSWDVTSKDIPNFDRMPPVKQ